jgi:hypothetical protein
MRTWLARLSFSFLIVAFVLAWQGYKTGGSRAPTHYLGAAAAFGVGLAGVRERHRPSGG